MTHEFMADGINWHWEIMPPGIALLIIALALQSTLIIIREWSKA